MERPFLFLRANATTTTASPSVQNFLDGPTQLILLVIVFCCPIIPAGGWCWLKAIECCLKCLQTAVKNARKFAYIPMYFCLLILLLGGCTIVIPDFIASDQTDEQQYAFKLFIVSTVLALLTIIISITSTIKVLQGNIVIDHQRERTVYILALPSFYSLMCFLSMQQLLIHILKTLDEHWAWEVQFDSDKSREEFTLAMISFYMSAADVFESFAFAFFAMLTMKALARASAQQQSLAGSVREARLQSCIQKWTMSPMYMFCTVLCLEAMYSLIDVFSKYFHLDSILPPALDKALHGINYPPESVINIAFFTLTSIFSSLAILALFSIEHVFHDDLHAVDFLVDSRYKACKFLSNLKFWGVKIFVTAEFTAEIFVMVGTMDEIQKQLINSVLMSTLCFLVAILHIWAYNPRGRWISDDTVGLSFDNGSVEDGNTPHMPIPESDSTAASGISIPGLCKPTSLEGSETLAPDRLDDELSQCASSDVLSTQASVQDEDLVLVNATMRQSLVCAPEQHPRAASSSAAPVVSQSLSAMSKE